MRILLTYLVCVFVSFAGAQGLSVRGVVQDGHTGAVVPDAVVTIGDINVVTDMNGFFKLSAPEAARRLQVTHVSYRKFSGGLKLHNDTDIVVFIDPNVVDLDMVTVQAQKDNQFGIGRMQNVVGTTIYAGKKSEAVHVQDLQANLASNNSRQVYSKVPGINIFENDGTGSSIGIGGRGLNPNRISNFNMRQNGYDISADALGYPESYYTPPTEAIDRIEILRGAAGLQFGTQFGGMINYRFTEAPLNDRFTGDFRQTAGSYGFFNSFNRVAGTVNRYSYNAFYQYKQYDGWRPNSAMSSHNAFVSLKFRVSERLQLSGEYTHLNYLSQQPGGLTDRQFEKDPFTATRTRNWFRVNWNLLSLAADYKVTDRTRLSAVAFGLDAGRDALGFLGRADRIDDTSGFRNLLSDQYSNHGLEARLLHRYSLAGANSHFLIGTRYYRGLTIRKQGDADKSFAPRFEFMNPADPENSSYRFPSKNVAVFAENVFQFGKKLSITPGVRYENIFTSSDGYYRVINRNLAGDTLLDQKIPDDRSNGRSFVLAGIGVQYKLAKAVEVYGNVSQNYRSINFNDMRVVNPNFQVDPGLQDESGYTADAGFRGSVKDLLYFDVGAFYLAYNNRIGTALRVDETTYHVYRFRTNIGSSRNLGIESTAELDWIKLADRNAKQRLSTFVNYAFINAVYTGTQTVYSGKKVEYVPAHILRTGVTYDARKLAFTWQYCFTGQQFSDASNAGSSPSGIYGIIPAFGVMDLSASYEWKKVVLCSGVNNLANTIYFTRRAEGYPGPGIIPADPRNFYVTLRVRL